MEAPVTQLDFPALKRRVVDVNEAWAHAMRGICAEAARQSARFDEFGFDRAIAAYAHDIASPGGDFISLLDEADAAEALIEEAALYGTASEAAHHSTYFTRAGLRAA
jgi:hypothetical protein